MGKIKGVSSLEQQDAVAADAVGAADDVVR